MGVGLDDVAAALAATHAPLLDLLAAVEAGATGATDAAGGTGGTSAADAGEADAVRAARALVGDGFPEAHDLADMAGVVRDLGVPDVSADLGAHL